MTNTATEYGNLIREEIFALEDLLQVDQYNTPNNPDLNDKIAHALTELCYEEKYINADLVIANWLNETILDVTILRNSDQTRTRIELLRTCGNPYCEIVRDNTNGDQIQINTFDLPAEAQQTYYAPLLAQYLDEMAQQ